MYSVNNELEITIENIPLPWIPKIELYYPDLPQFPIIYINRYFGEIHIIACPVAVSYRIDDDNCSATFIVLANVTNEDEAAIDIIREELSERIGYSKRISKEDVINCCAENSDYTALFEDLWTYIKSSYGDFVPYGKFFEEIFSIVRFISAWQPKTGRQSEMRMLYNFMSIFGEAVQMPVKWSHLEYYVIPNLQDCIAENFNNYPNFRILHSAIRKIFTKYFTIDITIDDVVFKAMASAWKQNKDDFIISVTKPMYLSGCLTEEEKNAAEMLVDAFNRHSWRAAYFISSYMNISKEYQSWSKDFFVKFYEEGYKLKGYSEKAIACFLQQGFLNKDAIPIDTWIKTFYNYPLGIATNIQFFNSFSNLGKLERIIWLSSQSNKTNMKAFFNILWCQRYGTIGNGELRGINPIACYSCQLKSTCVGASLSKNELVILLQHDYQENLDDILTENEHVNFICAIDDGIPKKCYVRRKNQAVLIDEFSGYILRSEHALSQELLNKAVITFGDFIFSDN